MWPVYFVICWFVLALVIPVVWSSRKVYARARGIRNVICPADQKAAEIQTDAVFAIQTNLLGDPLLRVQTCSLWPVAGDCQQKCLAAFAGKS